MPNIPPALIGALSPILETLYTHAGLNSRFMEAGFPGDAPEGNKLEKCRQWMVRASRETPDALSLMGALIAEFMDTEPFRTPFGGQPDGPDPRDTVQAALAREGMRYGRGGFIYGQSLSAQSQTLAEKIRAGNGLTAVEIEYKRAYESIESDPGSAVTAASSLLEAVCKTYLEVENHDLPKQQTLGPLWSVTAKHLGLQPGQIADDDLKRILQGLSSIAEGVAALRTHAGSAHGRAEGKIYSLQPRHARLAVHSAHTMALFILETWTARQQR